MPRSEAAVFSRHTCFEVGLMHSFRFHSHENHEFFYCTKGAGHQYTPNKTYDMQPGDFFFFPAGIDHCARPVEEGACLGIVLMLSADVFAQEVGTWDVGQAVLKHLTQKSLAERCRIPINRDTGQHVHGFLRGILTENMKKQPGYRLAFRLMLEQMFLAILRDPAIFPNFRNTFGPTPVSEHIADVQRYMETNYVVPLTVAKLAKMACLSRSHFHAAFKAETGMNPIQYLNRIRIRAAQRMLRESDMAIIDIAESCGFANLSHFYHTFKKQVGMTPKQYALAEED